MLLAANFGRLERQVNQNRDRIGDYHKIHHTTEMQVHRRKSINQRTELERQTKQDTKRIQPIQEIGQLYHRVHNRRDSNFVAVATAQETKTASRKLASKAIA